MEKIVILTGAGISAESGLGTFRDSDGIWSKYRIEDVATPDAFDRNPALVHAFYNQRRAQAAAARLNPAHTALAHLQDDWRGEVVIITQNVDDLHKKAGAKHVLQMHGALNSAKCTACTHHWPAPFHMDVTDTCPHCTKSATRHAPRYRLVW